MTSSRESSDLLMAVVDSLSSKGAMSTRETERDRLMEKFNSSDKAIDDIVDEHHDTLTDSIRSYARISTVLGTSQQRITYLKDSMVKCKKLLHCKRDYLLKLWVESREIREMLKMLDKIEEVKSVPEQVSRNLANKHYLRATKLLTSNVKLLETELKSIDALRDLRVEMRQLKDGLHDTLIDELHRHLYPLAPKGRRLGAYGSKEGEAALDAALRDHSKNPENDSSHFMKVIVESLGILDKLPEAAEWVAVRMHPELTKLVQFLIEDIAAKAEAQDEEVYFTNETEKPAQPKLLLKLLRAAFDRFEHVARAHDIFQAHLKAAMSERNVVFQLYKEDVWSSVQYVMESLLTEYFDVRNAQGTKDASNFQSLTNMNQYFDPTKKNKPPRRNKFLFNFDYSTVALTSQSVLLGGDFANDEDEDNETSHPFKFLCKPSPDNVTIVFNEVMGVCSILKEKLSIPQDQHCLLSEFVEDFVRMTYMSRVREDMRERIVAAGSGLDAFKVVRSDDAGAKKFGPSKPIFFGTSGLTQCFSRCKMLAKQLPPYRAQTMDNIIGAFDMYRETTIKLFRELLRLNTTSEEMPVLSAVWTGDRSIVEQFKSFSSWSVLKESASRPVETAQSGKMVTIPFDQSPKQLETEFIKRYMRENTSQSDCKLTSHNTISLSDTTISMLACMQESLEWILHCYHREEFKYPNEDCELMARKELIDRTMSQVSDLCDRLLLVLHIELRFQCAYYLHPVLNRNDYVCQENASIDTAIVDLNRFLSGAEECLSGHLQPAKVRYLLSGLGHFLASLILDACEHITRINRHGIKKLCRMVFSLQQNLTNLTMAREVELDRARQYCELFHLHADELCQVVLEGGRIFTERQYRTALDIMMLQGHCSTTKPVKEYQRKLQNALSGRRSQS